MFYNLNVFFEDTEGVRHDDNIKSKIVDELQFLRCELAKHFPNISRDDLSFVSNPYLVARTHHITVFNENGNNQDEFMAIEND